MSQRSGVVPRDDELATVAPSMADPPFAVPAPIVHVIDLPLPPSVNRIWRANKAGKHAISRSPEYTSFLSQADKYLMSVGGMRGRKTIYGAFSALIELKRPSINADLDNRIKAVLDWAEHVGLIVNDHHCVDVRAIWSTQAFTGCRLTLRSIG